MGKKNLDQLFQEKFKDFSDIPEERVWGKISDSLDKKNNKRRIIPFWWKLGGAAALLAVAIYLINPFDTPINDTPSVTDVEKIEDATPIDEKRIPDSTLKPEAEAGVANVNSDNQIERENELTREGAQGVSTIDTKRAKKNDVQHPIISESEKTSVAQNESKNESTKKNVLGDEPVNKILKDHEEGVAFSENNKEAENTSENLNTTLEGNIGKSFENTIVDQQENALAQEKEKSSEEIIEESQKKKSIFEVIEAGEAEEQIAASDESGKWSVGANVAPVYFSSFGEGSPVHSIFVPNSKAGDVNLSYGLSVAYELSKKLSIRSGISKVDYGYDTNEIEFTSAVAASNSLVGNSSSGQIDNISYTARSQGLIVTSKAGATSIPQKESFALDVAGKSASREGTMTQQFGYVEVPVELDYALVDKRVGVNLIGGISSLFLVDNSISLSSEGLTTEMGEAKNLNSMNFSGNVGFGVNYKFTPQVQLNIEPVFKYQLNTFSNTDGTFQPFSIGVYSGLSFRF